MHELNARNECQLELAQDTYLLAARLEQKNGDGVAIEDTSDSRRHIYLGVTVAPRVMSPGPKVSSTLRDSTYCGFFTVSYSTKLSRVYDTLLAPVDIEQEIR